MNNNDGAQLPTTPSEPNTISAPNASFSKKKALALAIAAIVILIAAASIIGGYAVK